MRLIVRVGLLAVIGMAMTTASASAIGLHSSESGVRFSSKTISVSRAVVRQNLVGIARNGTFKFK
ncbi:hypothetical protein ACSTK8_25290, partial [Vibrio parahaemolyticus]